jgi:tetratricopeptide (TPR) repeat protein
MRRGLGIALLAGLLALGAWLPGVGRTARADEVDDLAARSDADAGAALEALLDKARAAKDTARVARLDEVLARRYERAQAWDRAVPHLEALVESGGGPKLRIRYAEALVHVAQANIATQGPGLNVAPFLRDAVDAVSSLPPGPDKRYDESWRARLVAVVAQARHLLQDPEAALDWLARAKIDSLPEAARPGLHDLRARILYAKHAWEESAAEFERAGNPIAAASAWDAARRPDRSVPIYAKALHAAPSDKALIARALASARYNKAHGELLAALADIPVPAGADGAPLLMLRSQLLEAGGKEAEALAQAKLAAARTKVDTAPLVAVGRLTILAAGPEPGEDAWDAAADAYMEALARDPESTAAAQGLNWIAGRDYARLWNTWQDGRVAGRCVRVQEALTRAMPDDALSWANLGNTLRVLGRTDDALAAYQKACEANPYDPAVRSDQGLAFSAAGRPQEALAAYEESVRLDSGHLAGRQNAARMLMLSGKPGDLDRAAEQLGAAVRTARAVGSSPDTYRYLLDRIWRIRRDPALR